MPHLVDGDNDACGLGARYVCCELLIADSLHANTAMQVLPCLHAVRSTSCSTYCKHQETREVQPLPRCNTSKFRHHFPSSLMMTLVQQPEVQGQFPNELGCGSDCSCLYLDASVVTLTGVQRGFCQIVSVWGDQQKPYTPNCMKQQLSQRMSNLTLTRLSCFWVLEARGKAFKDA